jgi:hypothetical protein
MPRTTVRRCCVCDNAYPHIAVETLQELHFEVLKIHYTSLTLLHQIFICLGPLKDALRGHWFDSNHEWKEAVYTWPSLWPKTFFLMAYINFWNSILKNGDYVEE